MKVCVLQPDYTGSTLDYQHHDPPRDLTPLLPDDTVDHLFLRKVSVWKQLQAAARKGYDVFINLCEGYLDWDIPSIDVIWALEKLNLPHTGPSTRLYDPSKTLMKYVAHTQGVNYPAFVEAKRLEDAAFAAEKLGYPLFVKPAHAGDSRGVDESSLVHSIEALETKCRTLFTEFDRVLVEKFIPGREMTVLVAGGPLGGKPMALTALEFIFPPEVSFKSYNLKITQHHPDRNVPVRDGDLDRRLREAACRVFSGFSGEGYARVDFRVDPSGQIFFLEINFACSIFYPPGHEGSADYILAHDPIGSAGFLRHIIAEGQERHRRNQKCYERRGDARSGFGIYASRPIAAGTVVWPGEERQHRIVTRTHVEKNWSAEAREVFRRYAYPLSDEVFALWDEDADRWAPQNHSCEPNTAFVGLDVVALVDIATGEELTLDYATYCGSGMEPFDCHCGRPGCRGRIEGGTGISVTANARRR